MFCEYWLNIALYGQELTNRQETLNGENLWILHLQLN